MTPAPCTLTLADGSRFHCLEAGTPGKPPLLLLHGFPDFSYSWRGQVAGLTTHAHLLMPDMRGYAQTGGPDPVRAYALRSLARELRDLIAAWGQGPVNLCGHDWGGLLAWTTAALYPEQLQQLLILNAPHPGAYFQQARRQPVQLLRSLYALFFQLPRLPEWLLGHRPEAFFRFLFHQRSEQPEAYPPEVIAAYAAAFPDPGSFRRPLHYYRAFLHHHPGPMPRIEVPVSLLWGRRDRALHPVLSQGLDAYCQQPPEVTYLHGCSHWLQHEDPEAVTAWLLDHLLT